MKIALMVLMITVAVAGCGSDSGGAGSSGVDKTKALSNLTPAEKAQLCDWTATTTGGYGKSMTCSDGSTASNDTNQAECVSAAPSCAVTVGQFETCMRLVGAVQLCDQLAKILTAPECQPVLACAP